MSSEYRPGLEGVTAGISAISQVDAERNRLTYRGYDVHDLVDNCQFDEVAYLLLMGKLPNAAEFAAFRATVAEERNVPDLADEIMLSLPPGTPPMDALKIGVAVTAAFDPDRESDTPEANRGRAIRLFAKMPALVVNGYRMLHRMPFVGPNPGLDHNA